jgi:hypothetical protein
MLPRRTHEEDSCAGNREETAMKRSLRALVHLYMLGLSGAFFAQAAATSEEPRDPRLENVLADWQKRQHWFQAVEYKVSGTHKVPKGAYKNLPAEVIGVAPNKTIPPDDVEAAVSFTILLDFVKGRHRRHILDQHLDMNSGKLTPLRMKDVFNGSVMKCLIPKEENPQQKDIGKTQPEMTIVTGNMKNGQFKGDYFPIFLAHGRIYTAMEPIIPGQLRNKTDPEYLYIHGTSVYENRPCLILRTQTLKQFTTSFSEYWVDTSRESAVVRFLDYGGKKVAQDIGISYKVSHGHWLPDGWRITEYIHGRASSYEEVRVRQITINPSITDADFELEVKPGMLVEERTDLPTNSPLEWPKSKLSVYRVKENRERETIPDPFHRRGDQYQHKHPSNRPRRRNWVWAAVFISLGTAAIFWRLKHRKSLGSESSSEIL